MRLRLADTKLDSNIEKPRSRFFVAPKGPSQIKEYKQPPQRFSLKLDSLRQQDQQNQQPKTKQSQQVKQQIDRSFNTGIVIMPSERSSEVNEQKFQVDSFIQQDKDDQNDIYEIDEYRADENNLSQTMERASIHSVKSEQSFVKQRYSQQTRMQQNESKGTNLMNQNFYRLSPFDKPMMGQVEHLVLTKDGQQQHLNSQQYLNQPMKQPEQFNEVEVQEEVNRVIPNYLSQEEVNDIGVQETTRDEIPFDYPPILMNYLKSKLVYENEIIELTTIQSSDVQMQEQLTQCQNQFKQVMQNRLGRIKIKLIEAQRVAEYVDTQWPFFIQTNTECLDRYKSNINRITNFSRSATIEELSESKYQPISDDSQEYLVYLQSSLKYIAQSIAICQSMLKGNPGSIDHKITDDLGGLSRLLDNNFINVLDVKLERFFLNPSFPLLQQIYSSLDSITTRLVRQVSNFATYLEGVHQNLSELLSLFLKVLCSFNSECCEFNRLLNISYRCTKIDLLLEIGMESIAAVKIPISNEGSQAYNQQLLKNSRAMEANAEGKLNKYIQVVVGGYPQEEIRSHLFDQEKRIKLLKHLRNKVKDLELIEMIQQYPLLIIQRVEYFQIVLNIQQEYRSKIDQYKIRIEIFNGMASIEKQVYDLQLQREVIKAQFLKTENAHIVETMLEQLVGLLSEFLNLQQRLSTVNWSFDMPIQILRLQQWISVEIGMTNKLQEVLQVHLQAYQSQFTYEQDCSKFDWLYKSLSRVIKYEPTVNEILYGTSDVFLKQVLQGVLQSSTASSTGSNLFDLSRTNPQLPFDIELLEHLDSLALMQNNRQLSSSMRIQYKRLYDNLSAIYNQYTIWQNVQSCRCLMDGEVLSEIIRSTLLFDEPVDRYQTLPITVGVLRGLRRGFLLNIKNNENCVFFKIFVEQGIQCLTLIQSHFEQLKGYLKLTFNAKKTVRIDDLNRDLQVKVTGSFRNEDDPINIIKQPILDGLTFYIERNTFLFQTKGATLDWDKKLKQTKITLDEMDRILQDAFVYLQKIIESSLLDHFQPKQKQNDQNSISSYLTFGPEEFYLQSEPLYQVQQSKLRAQKERLDLENILNNQVKDPEYKLQMKYFIAVIDEMLLWFKSIEKVSRLAYLLMGKIKQILVVEVSISEDYLRNLRLFCKEIQQLIIEIKSVERISPFNLVNQRNKERSAWNCPEHYRVTITASNNIDNQQLLVLKISTICVSLTQQLYSNAQNLHLFQQFILPSAVLRIEDQFIDDLNRLIMYFGMRKVQNKKDTEALYDKTQEDLIFRKQIIEIPSYCIFPGKYLLMCLNSFDILAKDFQLQLNLPALCDLNSIIQEYLDGQETPIISLQVFVEEHLRLLNFDVKGNKVKSKSNLLLYMTICKDCVIKIEKYTEMIKLVLDMSQTNAIVKQKSLNRVDQDANLTRFIESEQNDWVIFMSLVYQQVKQYNDDTQSNQIEEFQQYWKHFDYELKKQTKKQDELGPQRNSNVKLLIQLYEAFRKVLENDFFMI